MKLTLLSKTISTISLIAALSAVVGTGVQRAAQAQEARVRADYDEAACLAAQDALGDSFSVFEGVDLSDEQWEAYDAASSAGGERQNILSESVQSVVKPNANVLFFPKNDVEIPAEIERAAGLAASESTPDQIDTLTEKYGQYGSFIPEKTRVYTQAQFVQFEEIDRETMAQILAVMAPDQQQQYQANLDIMRRADEDCGFDSGPFVQVGDTYEVGGFF